MSLTTSSLAMPFLVYNLGGEMLYILEQRLAAQNIVREKAVRVLQDVGTAMFSEDVLTQLCKPQQMQSMAAIRLLFERVAHSSIMKLSESSMEKLFELMLMGTKYQLVRCTHPRHVVEITCNHLDSILVMLDGTSTIDLVKKVQARVLLLASEITTGEMANVRQTLLNVLQDKRIKVSLFLQDNVQLQDGTLVLLRGGMLQTPYDTTLELPGTVRYYNLGKTEVRQQSTVLHPDAACCQVAASPEVVPRVTLGYNLYTVSKKPVVVAAPPVRVVAAPPAKILVAPAPPPPPSPVKPAVTAEVSSLQNLASLIGAAPSKATGGAQPMPNVNIVNLFQEERGGCGGGNVIHITQITREELEKYNSELVEVMTEFGREDNEKKKGGGPKQAEEDLLDLLDMS